MGPSAHCHNRICDGTCDPKAKTRPETFARQVQPQHYGSKGGWLPTNFQLPCSISKAECRRNIFLYREKCFWTKLPLASMCRRDEQCASGHCTYPWGWLTGTCSQCKK